MANPSDSGRNRFGDILDLEGVELEAIWVDNLATHAELCKYLADLHHLLNALGTMTRDELAMLEAERATDQSESMDALRVRVGQTYSRLYEAYSRHAGKTSHANECRTNVSPAFRPQACNCNA